MNNKKLIFLLISIQFTHIVDFMLIIPLGPLMIKVWSISVKEYGLIVTAYTVSAFASSILLVSVIDKFSRKNCLIVIYTLFILSLVVSLFSNNYQFFLIARLFIGAFGGIVAPIVFSTISDISESKHRGTAIGTLGMSFPLSSVIGVPIGIILGNQFHWKISFLFVIIISIINLYLLFKFLPKLDSHVNQAKKISLKKIFKTNFEKKSIKALTLSFLLIFSGFSVIPFISPYLVFNVGITEQQLALVYFFGGFFTIFSSKITGHLIDKFQAIRIFIIFATISSLPIFLITNLPESSIYIAVFSTVIFMTIMSSRFIAALTMITKTTNKNFSASFFMINSSLQQLSITFASILSNYIIYTDQNDRIFNYNYVGLISISITALAIFIGILLNNDLKN